MTLNNELPVTHRSEKTVPSAASVLAQSKELPITDDYTGVLLANRPLLDLRAPTEFTRGAFPASANLPLLTNAERHEVGLCYRQHGQEAAIKLGARLVDGDTRVQRIAAWSDYATQHPDAVIYCFRGGMRSAIVQQWLHEAGWTLPRIKGGYKALRWHLITELNKTMTPTHQAALPGIIVGGRTGSGKTVLLNRLSGSIDLEGLAEHRGSSFGATVIEQPSNINFEHRLAIALLHYRQSANNTTQPPVYLEDEGRMVGRVCIPQTFRDYMLSLPCVLLETPLNERIDISRTAYVTELLEQYQQAETAPGEGFNAFADYHRSALGRIRKRLGGLQYQQALHQLERALHSHREHDDVSGYDSFIELLLVGYYDPMYDYQLSTKNRQILFQGNATEILDWSQSITVNTLKGLLH